MDAYCGVMDCYGVESFTKDEGKSEGNFYKIRAMANDQRHALYYEVQLSESDIKKVTEWLEDNDWEKACVFIKNQDTFVSHGPGKPNLIPNKELDPWG